MKKSLSVFLIFVFVVSSMTLCANKSYISDYKWKIVYKCYDDGCEWIWKLCKTVIFDENGFIYNKTGSVLLGTWTDATPSAIDFSFTIECGYLNGTIFYLDFPSVAMEGQGFAHFSGSSKVVKVFLSREEAI